MRINVAASLAIACIASVPPVTAATPLRIAESGVYPESLAAGGDGSIYISNLRAAVIYRASPGAKIAQRWISFDSPDRSYAMGLLVDDKRGVLWACTYTKIPGTTKEQSIIRTFDIKAGKAQRRFPFSNGGCNDFAIADDGTVYASDYDGGGIRRLRSTDSAFVPIVKDRRLSSVDGLAVLSDGSLLVNIYQTGQLFRVVSPNSARPLILEVSASRRLERPDGMRRIGSGHLIVAEGPGRIADLNIMGDRAIVRTIASRLPASVTSVACAGGIATASIVNFPALDRPGAEKTPSLLRSISYAPCASHARSVRR